MGSPSFSGKGSSRPKPSYTSRPASISTRERERHESVSGILKLFENVENAKLEVEEANRNLDLAKKEVQEANERLENANNALISSIDKLPTEMKRALRDTLDGSIEKEINHRDEDER